METTIQKPQDNLKQYHLFDEQGSADILSYTLSSGVGLSFVEVHHASQKWKREIDQPILEIHYCQEGRMEQEYEGEYLYLEPHECSIFIRREYESTYDFPLGHYHGIILTLQIADFPDWITTILTSSAFAGKTLADKLERNNGFSLFKDCPVLNRYFDTIAHAPKEIEQECWKVNILNILYFIGCRLNCCHTEKRSFVLASQVKLAKEISAYMAEHDSGKWTLEDLAMHFHLSKSSLQDLFKKVYGTSVYAFYRIQKIQMAAMELTSTDKSIAEIAMETGYENPSKFSSAFKDIMKETPAQYRKNHTHKPKIL